MKDSPLRYSDSFLQGSTGGLNSLISECSSLQASVTSLKHTASKKLSLSRLKFCKLKKTSKPISMKAWIKSQAYQDGKALIASKVKSKTADDLNASLNLVRSLVVVQRNQGFDSDGELTHPYASIKDLTSLKISQLLALNRRKFGESFPSSPLKMNQRRTRSQFYFDFDIDTKHLKASYKDANQPHLRRYLSRLREKPPTKSRTMLAEEQEGMFEQIEKMTPLNKLVLQKFSKYQPALRSKLHCNQKLDWQSLIKLGKNTRA